MRIDGIHYEHQLTVDELKGIRGYLVEHHQRILGDIALVNAEIDRQTQDVLPFENLNSYAEVADSIRQ
jgi:hypothetical protein